ncbi:ABC transporter ATP-binding protein [Achromobacter xylosoxidans]|uniref:ABC transporter ATP-binding protein n=1 Tax=Alcaligenes xylosoxydans xylosoxydans TaxID=85698 RepID=UPI0006C703E0|nr:ABC transporter ATP-binding protein [Achromobacter xylosoxidans]CUI94746.1 Lipoprotein-releasing system ATP-binding protein LolD [Achromobacter xylosoxidans]
MLHHPLIHVTHVSHAYRKGSQSVSVLRDVTLEIHPGETCALLGASGSGKSTLLNILGLLDRPSAGQFLFRGRDMLGIDENARAWARNREIGFVFQSFNLLPRMNALDNVALPLFYRGIPRAPARATAMDWLRQVGLADRGGHLPADLSGGQRQRVAIARALVGNPSVILADEPTGNLDQASAESIMALLMGLNRERAVTIVMVTHDANLAARFSRQIHMRDGVLHEPCHCDERR